MEGLQYVSPRLEARLAGFFYLLIFIAGFFSEFAARGRLVISSDAAATATNILAHPSLYRLGGAAENVVLICDTCLALLLYDLFKQVSRMLSLFAAVFRLILVAVMAASLVNYFAPLDLLTGTHSQNAFGTEQVQALALMSVQSYGRGYDVALVFFAFHCLLIGYLIFRFSFLPWILGLLMALAGVAWLTFIWHPLSTRLYPFILFPGAFGEGLFMLWLLVKGVNAERWNIQAVSQGTRNTKPDFGRTGKYQGQNRRSLLPAERSHRDLRRGLHSRQGALRSGPGSGLVLCPRDVAPL